MTNAAIEFLAQVKFNGATDWSPFLLWTRYCKKSVGISFRLNEVWSYIEDDDVRIFSLYGVRVIGKSTLLNLLNKNFSQPNLNLNFDMVILVKTFGVWITDFKFFVEQQG